MMYQKNRLMMSSIIEPPPLEELEEDEVLVAANIAVKNVQYTSGDGITLMDELYAASSAAQATRSKLKFERELESSKTFGDGMKATFKANVQKENERKIVVDALREQGNIAFRESKLELALEFYSQAIAKSGTSYSERYIIYGNRSLVYLKTKEFVKALGDADQCMQLNPSWVKAYVRKANALKELNETKTGSDCLEKGIKAVKSAKEKRILTQEYQKLFPDEYEFYSMPVLGTTTNSNGLEIPEVRDAMLETLNNGEWANEGFTEALMSNPILKKGMSDPRCAMLLNGLQENPTKTLQEYGSNPDVSAFLNELMKTMGSHFIKMGEKVEEVPLVDTEVQKVLENDKVKEILSNPETRRILEDCGNTGRLNYYMRDKTWGPRIQILRDHGLVKFES